MTNPSPRLPRMLDIKQVAELANASAKTVRGWIKRGELHSHRLSKKYSVSEEDLMSYFGARRS